MFVEPADKIPAGGPDEEIGDVGPFGNGNAQGPGTILQQTLTLRVLKSREAAEKERRKK